jgi:hypothetical protein
MQGVFVLGMHRSGTSAVARVVNLLGIPTCVEEDFLQTTDDNPRGYWESATLTDLNDRLLDALGCDWTCPLALVAGWEAGPALAPLRNEAAEAFARVCPTEQWVWKDPRNCLTLPFWLESLEVRPAVVLVHRNPLEIAASLRARDGFGLLHSLGLWERYLRRCLSSVEGLPVLVTGYDELLEDPLGWAERAGEFLERAGLEARAVDQDAALEFVDGGLRHASATAAELQADGAVSAPQRALFDALEGLRGAHDASPGVPLPPETPSTEALFVERRRARANAAAHSERYAELEAYARDLGERFLKLEEYARGLQQQHAALDEYARGLQQQYAALEEYARGLQARAAAR